MVAIPSVNDNRQNGLLRCSDPSLDSTRSTLDRRRTALRRSRFVEGERRKPPYRVWPLASEVLNSRRAGCQRHRRQPGVRLNYRDAFRVKKLRLPGRDSNFSSRLWFSGLQPGRLVVDPGPLTFCVAGIHWTAPVRDLLLPIGRHTPDFVRRPKCFEQLDLCGLKRVGESLKGLWRRSMLWTNCEKSLNLNGPF